MIQFLADNIDQLDLALDQLSINDRNFDRFALMLIDNVVELTSHRFIRDRASDNQIWSSLNKAKHDPKIIARGLTQNFDAKIKACCQLGLMDGDLRDSILNLHQFRNTAYHQGLRHDGILHSLTLFYFECACTLLTNYEPRFWGWSSRDKIPHRAMKYIGSSNLLNGKEQFMTAYVRLSEVASSMKYSLVQDLATDMSKTITDTDRHIEFLAKDSPEKMSRTRVIKYAQSWSHAFTDATKEYAKNHGCTETYIESYVRWVEENYPWKIKTDPVKNWKTRLAKLSSEVSPHLALKKYVDFMKQTESLRADIRESASQLDAYIEEQIDIMRGK